MTPTDSHTGLRSDLHGGLPGELPVLQRGTHRSARDGACVMEYTSVLAGHRFSDDPSCTHPALAELARLINDSLSDGARSALLVRAPELARFGPCTVGAAASAAGAALDLAAELHGTVVGTSEHRKLGRLRVRDRVARGWFGRHRDTWISVELIRGHFPRRLHLTGDPAVDRALVGALDGVLRSVEQLNGPPASRAPRVVSGPTRNPSPEVAPTH